MKHISQCYSLLAAIGSELIVDPIEPPGECLQMGETWNLPCPLIFIHLSSSCLFLPPPSSKCLSIIHVQVQHQLSLAWGLKEKKTDVQFSLPLCISLYLFVCSWITFAPFLPVMQQKQWLRRATAMTNRWLRPSCGFRCCGLRVVRKTFVVAFEFVHHLILEMMWM